MSRFSLPVAAPSNQTPHPQHQRRRNRESSSLLLLAAKREKTFLAQLRFRSIGGKSFPVFNSLAWNGIGGSVVLLQKTRRVLEIQILLEWDIYSKTKPSL